MRGRAVIFVILGVLIVVSLGGVVLLFVMGGLKPPAPPATAGPSASQVNPAATEMTATPDVIMILAASRPLERGEVVPTEKVEAVPWPRSLLPYTAVTETSRIVGWRARIAIAPGEPIFNTMVLSGVVTPGPGSIFTPYGSDAALQIPTGLVAISLPYDANNGVAAGLKDGDHISLIASWRLVSVDTDFQSTLPNDLGVLNVPKPGGQAGETMPLGSTGVFGRVTPVPGSPDGATTYVIPHDPQRYRLVTQVILKDALVLHMGYFGETAPIIVVPTPTFDKNATPPPTAIPPSPTPLPPHILTLVVTPQDALAINYLNRMAEQYPDAMQVTLVLRSAGDTSLTDTQSVTQDYMFSTFDIQEPKKLDYGFWGTPVAPTAAPARP